MHSQSKVMLIMFSAVVTKIVAAEAWDAPAVHALMLESAALPLTGPAQECRRGSQGASRGVAVAPVGLLPLQAQATADQGQAGTGSGLTIADAAKASAVQQITAPTNFAKPAHVTDPRGIVVRSGGGDCWRTGTWTPAQATVVGCDGVLARALPVPAPAEPGKPEPTGAAAPTPEFAPDTVGSATTIPDDAAQEALATRPESRGARVTYTADLFFDVDSAVLKPAVKAKLNTLASRVADSPVKLLVVVGHADTAGPTTYNQRLSERRKSAVVSYLWKKGLRPKRLFSEGKGETQPVASNASRAGRAKNRRVHVDVHVDVITAHSRN